MPTPPEPDYDVLIIGAGANGASLACALADSELRLGIVEAVPRTQTEQPSYDDRGLALALGTQQILNHIDVWPALAVAANPIRHIHVSSHGGFGAVRLSADLIDAPALGYVVPAHQLGRALLDRLDRADNVDWHCPLQLLSIEQQSGMVIATLDHAGERRQITTRLLVGADGARSRVRALLNIKARHKDYHQVAIVSSVRPALPHGDTAWERFKDTGPFALLPLPSGRCVVVCCVAGEQADTVLGQSDADFLALLMERFGPRLGELHDPGPRHSYPVRLIEAVEQYRGRVLLLGNAVHTVHPNAAQGYNLGLRDVAALARHLRAATDTGAAEVLAAYVAERTPDQKRVIRFTDTLASIFYQNWPGRGPICSLGMLAFDLTPAFKRSFTRRLAAHSVAWSDV